MQLSSTHWLRPGGALALAFTLAAVAPAAAQTAYGLATTGSAPLVALVTFDVSAPAVLTANVPISGLTTGQILAGLDTRPATGELFALGYNPTTAQAQLYTLNPGSGVLTPVGAALTLNLGTTTARVGFDFNPTVDRIRVTSGARTNFRLNPNTGALVATDGQLAYAATDVNAAQVPGVGASAYTNSYIGATATVLYDLDEDASRLVTQVPPNDGTLNTVAALSGVSTTAPGQATDLDIYYNPVTRTNVAYLATTIPGVTGTATTNFYTLNLTTGAATLVGPVGATGISDIALAITRTVPLAVSGNLAYALAGTNLLTFDTALPGTIRTAVGLSGVDASQTLVGLDVRPATNVLYALGYNAAAATGVANAQLYVLNPNGAASAVGAAIRLELGTGSIGFDFNPTVDRIRVVGANRANLRLNPNDGSLAATDAPLNYAVGSTTPSIGAVAYTNSFMGANAASGTVLYDYDEALNTLNTQAPPNDGTLNPVGSSGLTVNTAPANVDLDIYSSGSGLNTAYLVATAGGSASSSLYFVNLTTGAATLVGAIGNGLTARDIAVAAGTGVVTSAARPAELATGFTVYPNPATRAATVAFSMPRPARVQLTVVDALGRAVVRLDAGQLAAGPQSIRWEGAAAPGVYFVRLSFDGQPAGTRQLTLLN